MRFIGKNFVFDERMGERISNDVIVVEIFGTLMDGSLVIMEGSTLLIFCYSMDGSLAIMEGSSLLRFCYSNGW